MNKDSAASRIADSAGIPKTEALRLVTTFLDVVTDAITSGEEVNLRGLGTFKPTVKNARKGRNPATGETVNVPARRGFKFVASTRLKEAVKSQPV